MGSRANDVPSIDGYRGLAVLAIVLGHCWWLLGNGAAPLDNGPLRAMVASSYMGVDLLFVVSGFVLFLPAATNGSLGSLRSYAVRRGARILPAYYLCIAVLAVTAFRHVTLPQVAAHVLLVQHPVYTLTAQLGFGVDGVLWTLSVEMTFYAALPLVASWYARRPFVGLGLAFLLAEGWQLLVTNGGAWPAELGGRGWESVAVNIARTRLASLLPAYAFHFALGMTAAWVFVRMRASTQAPAAQLAAAVGIVAIAVIRGNNELAGRAGPYDHAVRTAGRACFFAVLVLATALGPRWARALAECRPARRLGDISYGVYLWHLPLIHLALRHLDGRDNVALLRLCFVVVPCSLVAGWLSERVVERPARRWARRLRGAPVPTRSAPFNPASVRMAA